MGEGGLECLFCVFIEGVEEDIGQKVAELVSDDIVLARGDKLNQSFSAGLCDDHLDILLDNQHFITLLNGLVCLAKDLFCKEVGESHTADVVDMDALFYLQALQFWEEAILVMFAH